MSYANASIVQGRVRPVGSTIRNRTPTVLTPASRQLLSRSPVGLDVVRRADERSDQGAVARRWQRPPPRAHPAVVGNLQTRNHTASANEPRCNIGHEIRARCSRSDRRVPGRSCHGGHHLSLMRIMAVRWIRRPRSEPEELPRWVDTVERDVVASNGVPVRAEHPEADQLVGSVAPTCPSVA